MEDLVATDVQYRYQRLLGRAPVWLVGVLLLPYVLLIVWRSREDAGPMGIGWLFSYGSSWIYFVTLAWLAVLNWWPATRLADAARVVVGPVRWFVFAAVSGLLFNLVDLATVGRWAAYPSVLIGTLIISPVCALRFGLFVHCDPRTAERKSQWPQLSIRVLMMCVAYLGVVMGLWMTTAPLGARAREYEQKIQLQRILSDSFKMTMAKQPQFSKILYEPLIADCAWRMAKYERARRRPWIDAEPGPTFPAPSVIPVLVP